MKNLPSLLDVRLWGHWLAAALLIALRAWLTVASTLPPAVRDFLLSLTYVGTGGVVGSAFLTNPKQHEVTP
jgi:hypothetical protein